MRRLTQMLLFFVEGLFLRAHGWKSVARGRWLPPNDYMWERKRETIHEQGHALNSQKKALGDERRANRMLPHV